MSVPLRSIVTIVLTGCFASAAMAAEPWKIDLNANVSTALNAYSDSWTGGEAGSFTWASQFLGVAERQATKSLNTKATLKLQFGQTKVQNKDTKKWSAPEKSSDLIDAEELLRLTLGSWVDPFVSVRLVSQFLDGRDAVAHYGNPLDISEGAGVSRTITKKENVEWAARLGGAARQVVDRYKPDSTGKVSSDVTNDGGFEFAMDLKAANAAKWVSLLSSLRVYEAVVSSKSDEANSDWKYPHIKWDNTLTLTFAKYLMLNLSANALYDKEISSHLRLKETFSAGLTYIYSKK